MSAATISSAEKGVYQLQGVRVVDAAALVISKLLRKH